MSSLKDPFMKAGCLTMIAFAAILASGVMKNPSGMAPAPETFMAQAVEVLVVVMLGMAGVTAIAFLGLVLFAPSKRHDDEGSDGRKLMD